MLNFIKKHIFVLLLILIALVVYHLWFFSFAIIKNGDWGYYYKDTMATLNIHWFGMWLGETYGRVLYVAGQSPTYAIYGYLTKYLNFDFVVNERIVYLWPVALLPSVFSYFLLRTLSFNRISSFVGALVYAYNTYFLALQTGHMTLMGAFAFAPLVILMYIKTLRSLSFPSALFTGILLALEFSYEPRSAYLTVWILLLYALFTTFLIKKKVTKRIILKTGIIAVTPLVVLGLLNLYWIIALLSTQAKEGLSTVIGRALFGNEFFNILYSFTLFHPFWTGEALAAFQPQPIAFYFWIIPFVAFTGLLINKKNIEVIFFGFIALLGILLSKQVGQPFGDLYPWLYTHLPGFNAFREASKFYYFVITGYAVLIAAFIDWVWKNWPDKGIKIWGKYLLTFIVIGLFLWNTKSLITGEAQTLFVKREIHNDYLVIKELVSRQQDFFRIFWVPLGSQYSYDSYMHPVGEWSNFLALTNKEPSEQDIIEKLKPGEVAIRMMNKPYADNLLDLSSVKYVFIPLEDNKNDDNVFVHLGKERNYYIREVDKLPFLSRINIGTKKVIAYENKNYRPHIYLTQEQETVTKNVPFSNVKYHSITPTKYEVLLTNIQNSFYLNFAETYHPDWRVRIGDFVWYGMFFNKNYFVDNSNHKESSASFNSFYIDPANYCSTRNTCEKNPDSSYDMKITLYFAPQSYYYVGSIISLTFLLTIVGYLIRHVVKKKFYEKKK